ncbi:MAG: hypothetical protein KDK60_01330, partial [Chlamydiia bacterium]|nr:hypothetical protein [Chlamydiia bacterium]
REETFSSYKIAFETLANETKTLYLHLNRTKHLKVPLTLIDQHGKTLKVAADKMEFLIQRRAVLALDYLRSLTDPEAIADGALSLLRIAQERNRQGIDDKDLQFFKNFGFVDGEAVEIDIGELTVDSPPKPLKQELETLSLQLQEFIAEETPAALPLFKRKRDLLFRSLP